jgi:hypothetical protein
MTHDSMKTTKEKINEFLANNPLLKERLVSYDAMRPDNRFACWCLREGLVGYASEIIDVLRDVGYKVEQP